MTEGRVLALELTGEAAVHKWREILGPTDPEKARIEAPDSIRAKYGKDKTRNAAHGSDSMHSAKRVRMLRLLHSGAPKYLVGIIENLF